jgi:hypothetical protein
VDNWHVGGSPVYTPTPTDVAASATAVGPEVLEHLGLDAVPFAIRGYTEKPVAQATDLDTSEPWGSLWRGEVAAGMTIATCRKHMNAVDWSILDRHCHGMAAAEAKAATKINRLDGELTGEWSHPEGLIETAVNADGKPVGARRHRSVERWVHMIKRWRALMARCSNEVLPEGPEVEVGWRIPTTDYGARMLTFDGTTHHGDGTHDSGYNRPSIAAHARIALALLTGEMSYSEWLRRRREFTPLPPYVLQFRRLQGGAKAVPVYSFSSAHNTVIEQGRWMHRNPRFRAVWAPGLWMNIMWKEAAGRLTTLQRSTRLCQVRGPMVNAIIKRWRSDLNPTQLRVATKMGLKRPNKRKIIALDYSQLDLHIESSAMIALARAIRALDKRIPAEHAERIADLPVMTATCSPGHPATLVKRKGKMISGIQFTSGGDSDANGGNLLDSMSEAWDYEEALIDEAVECELIGVMLSGDDTLICAPEELDFDEVARYSESQGLPMSVEEIANFLARYHLDDGSGYTQSLPRQINNQLFVEEKGRQTNRWIVLAGLVQRRHLLRRHPLRDAFDATIRDVDHQLMNDAQVLTADAIPWLLEQAVAAGPDDRLATGLKAMSWTFDEEAPVRDLPAGLYNSGSTEDEAMMIIAGALERRTVSLPNVFAAINAAPFSITDAIEVFKCRLTRTPLPTGLKRKTNLRWR